MSISIISPILNEAENLQVLNQQRLALSDSLCEWILVDGGSTDNTVQLAQEMGFQLVQSEKGRATQQNNGAKIAQGQILLFLHADTQLNQSAIDAIIDAKTANNAATLWGRFDIQLDGKQSIFRIIETMINLRSRLSKIATGDQGLFISKALFEQVGGFPNQPIMEDIEICKTLKRIQAPVCLKQTIITSSRRWETFGVWKTILLMWKLRFLYWLGESPETLIKKYLY